MFFTGMHQPSDAARVERAFVSVNRLRDRKSAFPAAEWIMDSGAFTEISKHGHYRMPVADYAAQIKRWSKNGTMLAAVAQDYMCEAHILKITGLTVAEHQRLTIERYDTLLTCDCGGAYIMPVLQGYDPQDYVNHIRQYGDRFKPGMWVGVGSVCKRNGDPSAIRAVLSTIKAERPDLRLHGFGLKITSLACGAIRTMLHSADSMAWSFSAKAEVSMCAMGLDREAFDKRRDDYASLKSRRCAALALAKRITGRDPNSWHDAVRFGQRIKNMPVQLMMDFAA